ncbi:MAG: hypothetical protein K2M04_01250 [Muribaculaceae bacterium]|nr:hypothetical protein [Muribaculaceae bacterium]
MTAVTSCGNEEVLPDSTVFTDIEVSVRTNQPASRAANGVESIEGYEMKCIMQLIDENNAIVGSQKTLSVVDGTATFTITGKEQEDGAVQALFWAEYVPTAEGAQKTYNTEDLLNVRYAIKQFDLSNENSIAACDAFAGKLITFQGNSSVELVRPFTKISFTPNNPEMAEGCTNLNVSYSTPTGYSVLSGTTKSTVALVYENTSFAPTAGAWFTSYIFGTQSSSYLKQPITIKATGAKELTYTIPANKVPTDANFQINLEAELGAAPMQDLDVTITIDGIYENDPNKPIEMEVGSFVDASGNVVASKDDAVAVIFAMGAQNGDDLSYYPSEFAGKTIKGYAVALSNITSGRKSFGSGTITDLEKETAPNGSMLTLMNNQDVKISDIGVAWADWSAKNKTTGENVTAWYVPSLPQLETWFGLIGTSHTGDAATGTTSFKALFPQDNLFDRNPIATVNYVSSSVNESGNVSGVRLNVADSKWVDWQSSGINVSTQNNQSGLVRPMFTIFE